MEGCATQCDFFVQLMAHIHNEHAMGTNFNNIPVRSHSVNPNSTDTRPVSSRSLPAVLPLSVEPKATGAAPTFHSSSNHTDINGDSALDLSKCISTVSIICAQHSNDCLQEFSRKRKLATPNGDEGAKLSAPSFPSLPLLSHHVQGMQAPFCNISSGGNIFAPPPGMYDFGLLTP